MIGLLVDGKEIKELEYLLKREMEEILFDLEDERIDHIAKMAMEERYKTLFALFRRLANPADCMKYMRKKRARRT
ncbi:hypothetical protein [Bacillus sp. FJAT-27445]|uniref:hypothetical protein n=1 Tax=Bacillus sp. FJAT-27445 TaxID=1679166 RepID=UPI000743F466|nr:hypothetical protein [Bacillus sp. FJAT-27445]